MILLLLTTIILSQGDGKNIGIGIVVGIIAAIAYWIYIKIFDKKRPKKKTVKQDQIIQEYEREIQDNPTNGHTDQGASIQDIFPDLLKHSQTLENLSILIDHPWILKTQNVNDRITYIFSANKELVESKNGLVEIGRWEYYSNAKSILIETGESRTLYNQIFIDNNILLLKHEGVSNMKIFLKGNCNIDFVQLEQYIQQTYRLASKVEINDIKTHPEFMLIEKPVSQKEKLIDKYKEVRERNNFGVVILCTLIIIGMLSLIPVFQQKEKVGIAIFLAAFFFISSFVFWLMNKKHMCKSNIVKKELEKFNEIPHTSANSSKINDASTIIQYEKKYKKRKYTFKMGSSIEYEIGFSDGRKGTIYHKLSNDTYFTYDEHNNINHFSDKQSCIYFIYYNNL